MKNSENEHDYAHGYLEAHDEDRHAQTVLYSIKIKAELEERISQHVRALKFLEGGYSKKRLIQEAIKEKLQLNQNRDFEKAQSDRTLNFSISRYTHDEIDRIIKILKQLKISTSKTEFFLEAIIEKLNRDEMNTKKLFQNMLRKSSEKIQSEN